MAPCCGSLLMIEDCPSGRNGWQDLVRAGKSMVSARCGVGAVPVRFTIARLTFPLQTISNTTPLHTRSKH